MPLTFTRAEFLQLVEVPNDVLGYWLQNRVILPLEEGGGRGQPRAFGPEDLMLGAIFRELHGYGIKAKLYSRLAANAYAMIQTGRAVQLPYRLLPHVLSQALALREGAVGLVHANSSGGFGVGEPDAASGSELSSKEASLVDELASDLDIEEAANLDGYYHLTNPAYLRKEDPPRMVWDYVAAADGYELLERHSSEPSMIAQDEHCASCITISLTTLARRLWGIEGSRIGRMPFGESDQ